MNKEALVRQYEPVLRFSIDGKGLEEQFFPMAVEQFVENCTLYSHTQTGPLSRPGELNLTALARMHPQKSRLYYLSLVAHEVLAQASVSGENWLERGRLVMAGPEPLPEEMAGEPLPPDLANFMEPEDEAMLAFGLGELVEGRVRQTAQAVTDAYQLFSEQVSNHIDEVTRQGVEPVARLQRLPPEVTKLAEKRYQPYTDFAKYPPQYYYRTLNNRGFNVIQYWFFYAFNDWGTNHAGMNDHEGDWETVMLFLEGTTPRFISYAAHGGMATYRWEQVEKEADTHPVVYVGCGSHASFAHKQVYKVARVLEDYAMGNHKISLGPGAAVPWAEPLDLAKQLWALNYSGGWGAAFTRFGTNFAIPGTKGPPSPPWQFESWERPVVVANIEEQLELLEDESD